MNASEAENELRIEDGWHSLMPSYTGYEQFAPYGVILQFMREGWDAPLVCKREELNPMMIANGLYWRKTGLAKKAEHGA